MSFVTYYSYCHSLDGATLFSKVDSNKLRINVKNKMTFIAAKFNADLINISEVTSHKTKWPRFFGLPCSCGTEDMWHAIIYPGKFKGNWLVKINLENGCFNSYMCAFGSCYMSASYGGQCDIIL